MRAILSAPGSRGDVNPMIAIGKRLRQAGHEVVISLAEPYAELAESAGLMAEPIISKQQFTEAVGTASVWKPVRGPIAVFRLIISKFLGPHEEVIRKHHVEGETVLVAHPLDLVSRIFRDAHPQTPMVTVLPQPVVLRTYDDPPRLSPWWFEFSKPQWALRACYWLVDRAVLDTIIGGPVNRKRAEYDLPPIGRFMDQWWLSPDRILAMFPQWFAPATAQFCPRLVHCGFPLDDISGEPFEPPVDRPIVFTSGTAHQHCRRFFERAVDACNQLGRSGLLLSTHAENFPVNLPQSVRGLPYVSLAELLPHCSAIVHHGGVGTTSQALAAGVPQVIRPLAFDQFDNAKRVEQLGCGRWLKKDRRLTETLGSLLDENRPCGLSEIAQRLSGSDGPGKAVAEIDKLLRS